MQFCVPAVFLLMKHYGHFPTDGITDSGYSSEENGIEAYIEYNYSAFVFFLGVEKTKLISVWAVYVSVIIITVGLLLLTFCLLRRYAPEILKVIAGRK